jgi:hypothetical protein
MDTSLKTMLSVVLPIVLCAAQGLAIKGYFSVRIIQYHFMLGRGSRSHCSLGEFNKIIVALMWILQQ